MFLKYLLLSLLTLSLIYKNNAARTENTIRALEDKFQMFTDVGKNITLPCWPKHFPNKSAVVYWERSGKWGKGEKVLSDGSLFIYNLSKSDTKLYICHMNENDHILTKVQLHVRGPPASPSNVTVNTTTLNALVTWHQPVDSTWQEKMGGVRIFMKLRYRIAHISLWKLIAKPLSASQNHVYIYNLKPNSTYEFQVWSYNKFGKSDSISVFATTNPDLNKVESSYRMLESSNESSPRVWLMAIVVVLLAINVSGTIVLILYSRKNTTILRQRSEDCEHIELVPNIIENPSYSSNSGFELIGSDSNLLDSSSALIKHSEFV